VFSRQVKGAVRQCVTECGR